METKDADSSISTNSSSPTRRVKVYQLDEQSQWKDKGTGYVNIVYAEIVHSSAAISANLLKISVLLINTSETRSFLYRSEIRRRFENRNFGNQHISRRYISSTASCIAEIAVDTLIVWNDSKNDLDLALSFEEAAGCKDIWDRIQNIQNLTKQETEKENEFNSNSSTEAIFKKEIDEDALELPPPNIENLDRIAQLVSTATSRDKSRIARAIVREDYVRKLLDLFQMLEDLESKEHLSTCFIIFKGLILLNDTTLFDVLFSDEYMMEVFGPLEYDPDLPRTLKHREYLSKQVVFRQVIPFKDPELVKQIHQTFRITYLKDVVLPRTLDDPTFSTLNSLIYFNNVSIVACIQSDHEFLAELFKRIKDPNTPSTQLKDLISFVQELCNLARNFHPNSRNPFYQTMLDYGIRDILQIGLSSTEVPTRLSTIAIMENILSNDASFLRNYILSQKPDYPAFSQLIQAFLHDPELGVRVQLAEILRTLLDSTASEQPATIESDEFLNVFYQTFILKLISPFNDKDPDVVEDSVLESICDIFAFCVRQHGYRIKYFILGNNIVAKVLKLMKRKEKYLQLAAVRFFRAFVGKKDDFYNRHLTKFNLFEPIITALKENGSKYNLLNSALLEVFDFIRRENVKPLIQHLAENYAPVLQQINYVDTFRLLLLKYEQQRDGEKRPILSPPSPTATASTKTEGEDDYFDKEDENVGTVDNAPLPSEKPFKPYSSIVNVREDEPHINLPPMSLKRTLRVDEEDLMKPKQLKGMKDSKITFKLHLNHSQDSAQPQQQEQNHQETNHESHETHQEQNVQEQDQDEQTADNLNGNVSKRRKVE